MENRLPLVYFHGLVPNRYMAIWPVYVVGDAMGALEFSVTCEASTLIDPVFSVQDEGEPFGELRREYAAVEVPRRIHQRAFRERVLRAYRHQCAFCSLRHGELLDAAHITPCSAHGVPVVVFVCVVGDVVVSAAPCGVRSVDLGGASGLCDPCASGCFGGG